MLIARNFSRWYGRLFARPSLVSWHKFLVHLGMRGLGIYNFGDFFVSGESYFLSKYLSGMKQPIIFDVGANIGSYGLLCQKINSNAKVFCFEPHPNSFALLQKETEFSSNIITVNLALSNNFGTLYLYDYQEQINSRHATLCSGVIEAVTGQETVKFEVQVSTIDRVIEEHTINKIHLLKIDVEGHDLQVIQGAKNAIANNIIEMIQFEFTKNNAANKVLMKDFFELLSDNFSLYRLLPYGLLPLNQYNPSTHEIFAYQNIVCLRKGSTILNKV